VLLVAFAARRPPTRSGLPEIVTRGGGIPGRAAEEVVHHYEQYAGRRSPLAELTFAQARGLEQALARVRAACPCSSACELASVPARDADGDGGGRGRRRALAIILSPLRTEASWERYMQDVAEARARVASAPEVGFAPACFEAPRFVAAVADRAGAALAEIPQDAGVDAMVFTAHSVPSRWRAPRRTVGPDRGGPRGGQTTGATRGVGRLSEPKRQPARDVARAGHHGGAPPPGGRPRASRRRGAIGFVCDHVEVLYDSTSRPREWPKPRDRIFTARRR